MPYLFFFSYQHTKVSSNPRNLFVLVCNRNFPGSHWLTLYCWQNTHMLIRTQNAVLDLAGKLLLVVTAVVSSAQAVFLNVYDTLLCPICTMLFFYSSLFSPLLSGSSLWFCVRYYFSPVFSFDQTQEDNVIIQHAGTRRFIHIANCQDLLLGLHLRGCLLPSTEEVHLKKSSQR